MRKATISFVMSVRPMQQFGTQWTDFHEIWYLRIFFLKGGEKMQVALNRTRITALHVQTDIHFRKYLTQFVSEWEMLQRKVRKTKTHILCGNFLPKILRSWDYVGKYGRSGQVTDDNIIRRMRIAWRITKATNTHSEYVIITYFPLRQWLQDCTAMLRYTYSLKLLRWISGFSGLEVT